MHQMLRHSEWRTFLNLFGRFSKDDEIIYTECVLTNDGRTHIRHENPSESLGFCRNTKCLEIQYAQRRRTEQRAHAHMVQQPVCDRNMRNWFYSLFIRQTCIFFLFIRIFFLFVVSITYVQMASARAPFTMQWNFKRWHVWRARALCFKHCMTRISFFIFFTHFICFVQWVVS